MVLVLQTAPAPRSSPVDPDQTGTVQALLDDFARFRSEISCILYLDLVEKMPPQGGFVKKKGGTYKLQGKANSMAKSYLSAHTTMQRLMLPFALLVLLLSAAVPAAARWLLPESFALPWRQARPDKMAPPMAAVTYIRHGDPRVLRYHPAPPPPKRKQEKEDEAEDASVKKEEAGAAAAGPATAAGKAPPPTAPARKTRRRRSILPSVIPGGITGGFGSADVSGRGGSDPASSSSSSSSAAGARAVVGHPRPIPGEGQVLVRVAYASVNPCDFKFRRNWVPGFVLPKPSPYGKIPGADVSGVVVAIGPPARDAVWPERRFRRGDRVAAMLPLLGTRWGACESMDGWMDGWMDGSMTSLS